MIKFKNMKKSLLYWMTMVMTIPFYALSQENVDQAMMQKIREEGLKNSKVMEIAFNLTDKSGDRLTNSEGYMRAANYAKETLAGWGLQNAAIDPWGEFGKGWELEKSYLAMTAPYYKAIQNYPKAWTGGTKGLKSAEIVAVAIKDSASLEQYRGTLKGKIIIIDKLEPYKQSFSADATRFTKEDLAKMEAEAPAAPRGQAPTGDTAMMRRFQAMRASGNVLNLLNER